MFQCPECDNSMDDSALACEKCGTLRNRDELKILFLEFKKEKAAQNWTACMESLRRCLELVPENTKQHRQFEDYLKEVIHVHNNALPLPPPSTLESPEKSGFTKNSLSTFNVKLHDRFIKPYKNGSPLTRISFQIIAKTIFILYLVMSSTRVLLLGFTKKRTLFSLLIWIGSLSLLLGWKAAAGFGVLIYFHEMGHLLAIQYFGFNFAWPFFVPFVGAFVLHGKLIESPRKNAIIALSGPLLGTMVSLIVYLLKIWFDIPEIILKIAYLNLLINFLNLMPFWILDGARLANLHNKKQLALIAGGMLIVSISTFNIFALIMFCCYMMRILLHEQILSTVQHRPKQKENLWDIAVIQTALMVVCLLPLKTALITL